MEVRYPARLDLKHAAVDALLVIRLCKSSHALFFWYRWQEPIALMPIVSEAIRPSNSATSIQ